MVNDQIVPRPDTGSQSYSSVRLPGTIGRGGQTKRPDARKRWIRSSPIRQPSQKGCVSGSSSTGSRNGDIVVLYLRKRSALVGTHSPLVTRLTSAPSTWLVEVPRIWRTPSSTRLNPCTYASDMPPPDVFVGRRPSGHSSAPSSVKAAPSPRPQNP